MAQELVFLFGELNDESQNLETRNLETRNLETGKFILNTWPSGSTAEQQNGKEGKRKTVLPARSA